MLYIGGVGSVVGVEICGDWDLRRGPAAMSARGAPAELGSFVIFFLEKLLKANIF